LIFSRLHGIIIQKTELFRVFSFAGSAQTIWSLSFPKQKSALVGIIPPPLRPPPLACLHSLPSASVSLLSVLLHNIRLTFIYNFLFLQI
jgi:hypothetical protein